MMSGDVSPVAMFLFDVLSKFGPDPLSECDEMAIQAPPSVSTEGEPHILV